LGSGCAASRRDPCGGEGDPAWPPLALFKALPFGLWHDRSDLALAEALDDRASFRRFCGFSSSEAVPERTAFVRFRKAPVERRLDEVLLGAVVGQLEAQGLVVRSGTLIDATVIRQATKTDGEAEWCVYAGPRRTPVKGEALVAADEDGGIVRRVIVTPGSVHDSRRFEPVLPA
jgi:IS5 family transposase